MTKSFFVACFLAVAAASPVLLVDGDAHAQETTALEYFVGKKITAKSDLTIERTTVKKGTQGTVKKVHKSGGKAVALDIQIGATTTKLSINYVRDNFT